MPWMLAASATPCAWLPAEEHTTPRRRSSSVSCVNLFSGPRILYEPGALEHLRLEADVEAGRARSASATTAAACDECAARRARTPPRTPRSAERQRRPRSFGRALHRRHHDLDQPVRRHEAGLHRRARGKIAARRTARYASFIAAKFDSRSGRRGCRRRRPACSPPPSSARLMRASVSLVCAATSPALSGGVPEHPGQIAAGCRP